MKIMIVDDHPVVRQGIRLILGADAEIEVVAEAANAREAMEQARHQALDLIVLDLNLPDQNGFWVLKEVRRIHPDLPVLILSIQPEEHMAVRALKAGASGFLNKESAPEELVKAVRSVMRGKRYISPRLAEWLAVDISGHRESLPHERLSDREYQVLCLLASGKSISDIAATLHRSPNTISTYRTRILHKMGIETNAGLTHYALTHQLIK
ncbi:response regulator [Denitratisoma oestradiolicum]|uniref:Response regulator containing a CheY-like receiver domain and an HTH DNA-binding domain n=1 Tax=Denitratisoma oestradiolicum TaxID=311182 RepID=A0A6S6XQ24_9PROT|nr:response regulator transcription factor [Denitratisoma oestradiolicum]TWO79561.1 DNA-binding response regulator [Denitratisoma oestradiolicum]CAB1368046.1 Response regulator containing a CheY-like receiver domain and an HTH DNA-binding domain [Denitratisoma oestradiolicum]